MTNEEAKRRIEICRDFLANNYSDMGEPNFMAFDMAIKALEQEPKTGHWIEEEMFDGEVVYKCSKCGGLYWLERGTPKDNKYNFCPNCGARMAESEDKK